MLAFIFTLFCNLSSLYCLAPHSAMHLEGIFKQTDESLESDRFHSALNRQLHLWDKWTQAETYQALYQRFLSSYLIGDLRGCHGQCSFRDKPNTLRLARAALKKHLIFTEDEMPLPKAPDYNQILSKLGIDTSSVDSILKTIARARNRYKKLIHHAFDESFTQHLNSFLDFLEKNASLFTNPDNPLLKGLPEKDLEIFRKKYYCSEEFTSYHIFILGNPELLFAQKYPLDPIPSDLFKDEKKCSLYNISFLFRGMLVSGQFSKHSLVTKYYEHAALFLKLLSENLSQALANSPNSFCQPANYNQLYPQVYPQEDPNNLVAVDSQPDNSSASPPLPSSPPSSSPPSSSPPEQQTSKSHPSKTAPSITKSDRLKEFTDQSQRQKLSEALRYWKDWDVQSQKLYEKCLYNYAYRRILESCRDKTDSENLEYFLDDKLKKLQLEPIPVPQYAFLLKQLGIQTDNAETFGKTIKRVKTSLNPDKAKGDKKFSHFYSEEVVPFLDFLSQNVDLFVTPNAPILEGPSEDDVAYFRWVYHLPETFSPALIYHLTSLDTLLFSSRLGQGVSQESLFDTIESCTDPKTTFVQVHVEFNVIPLIESFFNQKSDFPPAQSPFLIKARFTPPKPARLFYQEMHRLQEDLKILKIETSLTHSLCSAKLKLSVPPDQSITYYQFIKTFLGHRGLYPPIYIYGDWKEGRITIIFPGVQQGLSSQQLGFINSLCSFLKLNQTLLSSSEPYSFVKQYTDLMSQFCGSSFSSTLRFVDYIPPDPNSPPEEACHKLFFSKLFSVKLHSATFSKDKPLHFTFHQMRGDILQITIPTDSYPHHFLLHFFQTNVELRRQFVKNSADRMNDLSGSHRGFWFHRQQDGSVYLQAYDPRSGFEERYRIYPTELPAIRPLSQDSKEPKWLVEFLPKSFPDMPFINPPPSEELGFLNPSLGPEQQFPDKSITGDRYNVLESIYNTLGLKPSQYKLYPIDLPEPIPFSPAPVSYQEDLAENQGDLAENSSLNPFTSSNQSLYDTPGVSSEIVVQKFPFPEQNLDQLSRIPSRTVFSFHSDPNAIPSHYSLHAQEIYDGNSSFPQPPQEFKLAQKGLPSDEVFLLPHPDFYVIPGLTAFSTPLEGRKVALYSDGSRISVPESFLENFALDKPHHPSRIYIKRRSKFPTSFCPEDLSYKQEGSSKSPSPVTISTSLKHHYLASQLIPLPRQPYKPISSSANHRVLPLRHKGYFYFQYIDPSDSTRTLEGVIIPQFPLPFTPNTYSGYKFTPLAINDLLLEYVPNYNPEIYQFLSTQDIIDREFDVTDTLKYFPSNNKLSKYLETKIISISPPASPASSPPPISSPNSSLFQPQDFNFSASVALLQSS